MIVRNFEYLIALGRELHFARAAAACNVSQPTLSAGIKQLEEDMGVLIVKRGHRLQGFTPEGERVLAWARQMLADCDRLRQELQGLQHDMSGPLRIGVLPSTLPVLMNISVPFTERYPKADLSIRSLQSEKIIEAVRTGEIDLGLTFIGDQAPEGTRLYPLYREKYLLFTSDELHLEGRKSVRWAEALQRNLCLLSGTRFDVPADRPATSRLMYADSPEVLAAHVNTGKWSTVLTQSLAHLLSGSIGLHAIPLAKPHNSETVGFVTAQRDPLPALVHAFLEITHDPQQVLTIRKTLSAYKRFAATG